MSYDALKSNKNDDNRFFSCEQSLYHSALEDIPQEDSDEEENYYTYLHESRMNSMNYYTSL